VNKSSLFFEIAFVPVYFDHFPRRIINADHSIMRPAAVLRVSDCIADRVWFATADRMAVRRRSDRRRDDLCPGGLRKHAREIVVPLTAAHC